MSSVDRVVVVVVGGGVLVLAGASVALYVHRGREHRRGMEQLRETCRARGLEHGPDMWETVVDGQRVGVRAVRCSAVQDDDVNRRHLRWRTSYLAPLEAPLPFVLDVFVRVQRNAAAPEGDAALPDLWVDGRRPRRVELAGDPFGGRLQVHASDPQAAAALLDRPAVVEWLHQALALGKDLRVTSTGVELLDEPYEADVAALDLRLHVVAQLAIALTAR